MKYIPVFLFFAIVQSLSGQHLEYKIGDTVCCGFGSTRSCGIVFYVENLDSTKSGPQHGLVCAFADQHTGIRWYNGSYIKTYAIQDHIYAKGNADTIIERQNTGDYAATICAKLNHDTLCPSWYLPSREELLLIYKNIANNSDNIIKRTGNFKNEGYWSSLEESRGSKSSNKRKAYIVDFYDGRSFPVNKSNKYRVRAVREFRN